MLLAGALAGAQQGQPTQSAPGYGNQQPGTQQPNPQQQGTQQPSPQLPGMQRPGSLFQPQGQSQQHTSYGDGLHTRWEHGPGSTFEGWPAFPNQLSGYGSYTRESLLGGRKPLPLASAPPEPEGWPMWMHARAKEPLPYAPEFALLARLGDRVWWRPADDEPFVPMYFHDKFRTLRTGARIEVRQNGEFVLLLHRSTRVLCRGPSTVELGKLDEHEVQLRIGGLTWMRIAVVERLHTIELPDGSTVTIQPPPPSGAPLLLPSVLAQREAQPGVTDLMLVRANEPGWLGGRATLANLGTTDVVWRHASGEVTLHPQERVTFFLQKPQGALPAALTTTGVQADVADTVVTCRAQQAGSAGWSGASFDLPAGASVRFDAQQGRPFAAPRAGDAGVR
jgi:hypothetical protein